MHGVSFLASAIDAEQSECRCRDHRCQQGHDDEHREELRREYASAVGNVQNDQFHEPPRIE